MYIIDLFSALQFEKILLKVLYNLLMEFKNASKVVLHPVSCTDGAIHAYSIKVGPGIVYYGMPHLIHALCNMKQLSEGLPLHNY